MGRSWPGVTAISDSSIEITFTFEKKRCRERIKLEPTPANLKRAAQFRAAVMDAIARGTFDYAVTFPNSKRAPKLAAKQGDILGVERYLEKWLEGKKQTVKSSTLKGYSSIVNGLLIPKFGKLMLSDIRRPLIKEWLSKIDENSEKKLTNKRLANIQSCLRSALHDAVEDELIDVNPMHDWTFAKKEEVRERDDVDPLSAEEQAAILEVMPEQTRNIFQFAFWTGLRTSELCGLMWGDVDPVRNEIHIRRALTRAAEGSPELPKTVSSSRRVKLLGPARQALDAQKAFTQLKGAEIFQNPGTGEQWQGDHQLWKAWARAMRLAKLRYRRPYQTRHTFASMMLSAGEHPMWVASQMGHKDWSMIARTYGKWMPSADMSAGSKAEALFSSQEMPVKKLA